MTEIQELPRARSTLQPSEHTLTLHDGTKLFYRAWLPEIPATKALLLFHRGHEHSGRWQETVAALGLEDVAVFAWDQRGHGRSPGERGAAPDLATVIHDADEWVRHLTTTHGIALPETIVLAHSLGAVIATAWVHDYAPPIRGLILATPAFRVKLYVPLAVSLLRLRQKLFGPGYVKSYVQAGMLTHDPEQARQYQADQLIFRQIAVNMLLDLHDTSTRLLDDAGAITVPLLVLAAGSDWVVKAASQQQFVQRVSSPVKRFPSAGAS
jgi:alpha-beta hydrolase superfamily lysophospholipase